MAPSSLYIGAAQIAVTASLPDNLTTILRAMRQGAEQGLEVLVFPETALTGYSPTIGHGRSPEEWPVVHEGLERIAQACADLGLWVVVGAEAWEDGAWWNRVYAFDTRGAQVATYDKVHLTRADTRFYRPGREYTLFDLKGVPAGLQICYDVRFPEGYRDLMERGAQIVLHPFYGAGGDTWKVPVLGAHLRSRAAESGCFVVASNVAGPLQIVVSQIVDPLGLLLAAANQDREEIVRAELSLRRVADSDIREDYLRRFRTPAGGPAGHH